MFLTALVKNICTEELDPVLLTLCIDLAGSYRAERDSIRERLAQSQDNGTAQASEQSRSVLRQQAFYGAHNNFPRLSAILPVVKEVTIALHALPDVSGEGCSRSLDFHVPDVS